MIEEGDEAVPFELPAFRDGDIEAVALEEYLGEQVIILAFYPADFNPACAGETTDLDELDLFTMQKDVTILGISGDSVYSHQAFAEEYNLHIPLLADVDGAVAETYGVATESDSLGYQNHRAIFVINHAKEVEYTWVAPDIETLPNTEEIRDTIEGVGSDETALARYRVGHAHYMEGRRAFTSAMKAFENLEWMMSQGDFDQAAQEFDEARDEFNTAVRFTEDEEAQTYFERAESKSEALWRAADWLRESASAFASGEGAKAESLRSDAEAPLEEARNLHEPPDPDDFPPDEDPAEQESDEPDERAYLEPEDEEVDTSLDLDEPAGDEEDAVDEQAHPDQASAADATPVEPAAPAEEETATEASSEEEVEIDDSELEEIAAELEEQTEAAKAERAAEGESEETFDDVDEEQQTDTADAQEPDNETIDGEVSDDDLEFELTDPTEGEDDADDESDEADDDLDESDGPGVPDSL